MIETTELDHRQYEVIELAMVPFRYSSTDGTVVRGLEPFTQLREPINPIPEDVTALTGITSGMVRGQQFDLERVADLVQFSHLIIAHNAGFDRKFAERISPTFALKPWG